MQYRKLGKTGFEISEISLGTWQVGGRWGEPFNDDTADKIINEAIDQGVNFIDTADVYSAGDSEAAVASVVKQRSEQVYIATKCGRQINPHVSEGYTPESLTKYVEQSLRNMKLDSLDLIQLHCPPAAVLQRSEIFETFDRLKTQGKIRNLGVSVETVDEAMAAIQHDNVTTIQIIFNMFRLKPAATFFAAAKAKDCGIIVRVPLASGMLSGKMTADTSFGKDDHRNFNRNGEAFDKGETFSGVDFQKGLEAAEKLKALFPDNAPLASWALRWVLMFPEVSTVIPGASRVSQVETNVKAGDLPVLTAAQMVGVQDIYDNYIKADVQQYW